VDTYPEIGKKEDEIRQVIETIEELRRNMARQGGVQEEAIRLEQREKEPYGMKGSSITLQQLKKNIAKLPEGTKLTELKSGGWIDCTALQKANTTLLKLRESLAQLVQIHLADACLAISMAGSNLWSHAEHWISHIDGTQCIAKVSYERGFSCPVIEDVGTEGSSLEIKSLRHPLVEATASRISYVKHDVSLGSTKGWLIYG
jgi:DNA mismatch repair ATPase MutS